MPQNEKERRIYIATLCLLMTYFNGLLNAALIQGRMSSQLFWTITKQEPMYCLIAFAIAILGMQKLSAKAAAKLFCPEDSPNVKIFIASFFMVLFMSPCVLLCRMLLQCGIGAQAFINVAKYWPRAFTFALFYQLLFAGPLARRLLKRLRG